MMGMCNSGKQHGFLRSYPIMFCRGEMKASLRRTTSFQTRLFTGEGVTALSFIRDDRVAQLDILSVVAIAAFRSVTRF